MDNPLNICFILGTRPEIIKLFPVIKKIKNDCRFRCTVISTSQHREMLNSFFPLFSLEPDFDLDVFSSHQSLTDVCIKSLQGISPILKEIRPDLVVVQGDTTSAFSGALSAFYNNLKLLHIEAGLRSFNRDHPFPEEVNRKMISSLAHIHCCPTIDNSKNLLKEGIDESNIYVTGNTAIDSLEYFNKSINLRRRDILPNEEHPGNRLILVTAHRRENFGRPIQNLCNALKDIAARHSDITVLYPVHLNPNIKEPVYKLLSGIERIHLVKPLPYEQFIFAMREADLIITDSGGVQEEALAFKTPVLVYRKVTERTEGIAAGYVKLVGVERDDLVHNASMILNTPADTDTQDVTNPYGDGRSSGRIIQAILHYFNRGPRPQNFLL